MTGGDQLLDGRSRAHRPPILEVHSGTMPTRPRLVAVQHSRNLDLDGVRGLGHPPRRRRPQRAAPPLGRLSGVTLFFVLSGYLITSLLIREWDRWGSISLWRFWGRRALRLLPALLLLLALTPPPAVGNGDDSPSGLPQRPLASLFYVGNWVRIHGTDLGVLNHLWSLSVEEQLYVVWPPAFIVLIRWFRSHALTMWSSRSRWSRSTAAGLRTPHPTSRPPTNAFALAAGSSPRLRPGRSA